MHGTLQARISGASEVADQMVISDSESTDAAAITDHLDKDWFVQIVESLAPKDSGYALHLVTGFEQRSCYRYASGERKPPAYFLRALLRSDQGKQWLAAIMDGSEAEWWCEHQRAERIVAQVDRLDLR
jgi:hypothetical protein